MSEAISRISFASVFLIKQQKEYQEGPTLSFPHTAAVCHNWQNRERVAMKSSWRAQYCSALCSLHAPFNKGVWTIPVKCMICSMHIVSLLEQRLSVQQFAGYKCTASSQWQILFWADKNKASKGPWTEPAYLRKNVLRLIWLIQSCPTDVSVHNQMLRINEP